MNLYDLSGSGPDAEKFDQLLSAQRVKIERIVSHGQSTPIDEWYDQGWDEWVIVVAGSAGLLIEGETEVIGKPSGSDEERGKATYPALFGIEQSRQRCDELLQGALSGLDVFGDAAASLRWLASYIVERGN